MYKKFSIPKPEQGEEIAAPPANRQPLAMKAEAAPAAQSAVNTIALTDGSAAEAGMQLRVDAIAEAAIKLGSPIFSKMFDPVLEMLDNSESLEDVRRFFEDEQELGRLMSRMDTRDCEQLLQRSMMLADLEGRVRRDG